MYEDLTRFLPILDGTVEPTDRIDMDLIYAISDFVDDHRELELNHYGQILESYGLKWDDRIMRNTDVSKAGARCVLALLVGMMRGERFSYGLVKDYRENGIVTKWLNRLKEIDLS